MLGAMFELVGVSKRFGETLALAPTDLEVARGRTTVLLGESGSGKSTLLRLMLALLLPDTGEVRFDGAPLTPARVRSVRHRVGYVVQGGGLFPHLTARGNVTLVAEHLGWTRARIAEQVEALRALARLPGDALERFPSQLSGGQRQRVSLMRALMLDPDALLLDEPLGALDPITRAELQEELATLFRSLGKTVVLVTHDLWEASFLGDGLVLLREGRIVQRGTFAELRARPADEFVQRFIRAHERPGANP